MALARGGRGRRGAGPLRAGKTTTFEGGIRVPFITRWPRRPANRTVSAPAMNIDLFPTLLRIAEKAPATPGSIDGKNITPVLLGTGSRAGTEFLFYSLNKLRAFRSGKWKVTFDKLGARSQLYDLSVDIGEKNNLAATQVARFQSLAARAKVLDAGIPREAPVKK